MGEYTPNLKLYKPAQGETGYAGELNNSSDIIDRELMRRAIIPTPMTIGDLMVWNGTAFSRLPPDPTARAYLRSNGHGALPSWEQIRMREILPDTDFSWKNYRITDLAGPIHAKDAATKEYVDTLRAYVEEVREYIDASRGVTLNLYGDGAEGEVTVTKPASYQGLKQFTRFTLETGVNLQLTGDTVILAQESITIKGAVDGQGAGMEKPGEKTSHNLMGRPGCGRGNKNSVNPNPSLTEQDVVAHPRDALLKILNGECTGAGSCGAWDYRLGNIMRTDPILEANGGRGGASLILSAPYITCLESSVIDLSGENGKNGIDYRTLFPHGPPPELNVFHGVGGGGGGEGGLSLLIGYKLVHAGKIVTTGGLGGAEGLSGIPGEKGSNGKQIVIHV